MLAYNKQYSQFCDGINTGMITDEIIKNMNRDFSKVEKQSF